MQCRMTLTLAIALSLVSLPVQAQLPQTRLNAVFPAGGQAGSTFDLQITDGADLEDTDKLHFSHPGISATQKMTGAGDSKKPVTNQFVVTIKPDVPVGVYEVRAIGRFGMSNPRSFMVSHRKEIIEAEPNNTSDKATAIEWNQIINARSNGGADLDFYKFTGQAGQRVIIDTLAQRIDSKMKVAVELFDPAGNRMMLKREAFREDPLFDVTLKVDGDYLLKVYDFIYQGGNTHHYRINIGTGPYIDYIWPPAGLAGSNAQYTLYGRNLPGGRATGIKVSSGQELQAVDVQISLPAEGTANPAHHFYPYEAMLDATRYVYQSPAGQSNAVSLFLATAPVIAEQEPNNHEDEAQLVSLPAEFIGQFQAEDDVDVLQFDAKKGDVYILEIFGQRGGSTVDPVFKLEQLTTSKEGQVTAKQLTVQDDTKTNLMANVFDTVTDDPKYKLTVPADGRYRVTLHDRYYENRGDPRLIYRLSIRTEQPDFRMVALPLIPAKGPAKTASTWALGLRKGESVELDLLAFKQDGFNAPVTIQAEGLPAGVTCQPVILPAKESSTSIIISAAENAATWHGTFKLIATAASAEPKQEWKHEVRSASIVWPASGNILPLARVTRSLGLSVLDETAPVALHTDLKDITAHQNSQVLIPVKLKKRNGFDNNVPVEVVGLPKNSNVQASNVTINKGQDTQIVQLLIKDNAALASYNIYLKSQAQIPYRRLLDRLEAAKLERDEAIKQETESKKQLAEATKKRDENNNKRNAAQTASQNADTNLANIKKQRDDAARLVAASQQKVTGVDKQVAQAKQNVDVLAKKQAELQKNKADEKAAAELKTVTEELAKANQALQTITKTQADTNKILTDQQKQLQDAEARFKQAEQAAADAKTALQTAEAAKKTADAAFAKADAAAKAATAAKTAAEKKFKAAENVSKPKNTNVYPPSTPIALHIKKAPASLRAAVPGGGTIKPGQEIEIKVTAKRDKDFKSPIQLALALPPGVSGLSAAGVTIPADKNEAVIKVKADANATVGQHPYISIRGTMDFEGKAVIDAPITLKVIK